MARVAREQLEQKTGREVVTPLSAKRFFEGQKPEGEIESGEKREKKVDSLTIVMKNENIENENVSFLQDARKVLKSSVTEVLKLENFDGMMDSISNLLVYHKNMLSFGFCRSIHLNLKYKQIHHYLKRNTDVYYNKYQIIL